ncbi:hypothetical protein WJX74_010521 [Apatococcus lobatus]|uniref:Dynamin-type G domain-containing protein n=1 Tax=Apatococcus lobatus TaxID=904363 RepID=A0AAW1QKV9_9CHLO
MEEEFARTIRPKLDVIDKVRPYLADQNIDLPAIVVIGDQSSGKSSLLESISGVALPRGGEIVTRCPLQLALRPGREGAVIQYKKADGEKRTASLKLEDVADAVSQATDYLSGAKQGISHDVISLQVTRPDAPILTLVDLPGITRMAVGDQPENIEEQVKNLINKYVEGEAKIILCVLPATQDFSTQEALTMAKSHDPAGARTIGVVTKIDMCQKAGIRRTLEATAPGCVRLKLGFVAIREQMQFMQKKIIAAGKIATNDHDAETMLITCTNQLQRRFQQLSVAVYEAADRAWDSFGGKGWAHSDDCKGILEDIIKESTGVALPDDGNSTAVYDTFRANVAAQLLEPSLTYLEGAHELVLTAVQELAKDAFVEFPNLSIAVQDQDMDSSPQESYAWEEQQELEGVKDQLRAEQSQHEKALREQQFRLAAFTTVVLRLLCDEVPKTIRLQLLRRVGDGMFDAVLTGVRQMDTSVLTLMQDPVRVRQYEVDKDALHKLEKAFAELKRI